LLDKARDLEGWYVSLKVSEEVESSKRRTVREHTVVGSDAHCPSVLLALEDEWGEQLLDLDDILVILLLH
jgi:hypothetical protein